MTSASESSFPLRWSVPFLSKTSVQINRDECTTSAVRERRALIILNQPFSQNLLQRVWNACEWSCCADGGANRLYDIFEAEGCEEGKRTDFVPDLIKGDMDSLREDVKVYYEGLGVPVIKDPSQYATDLMKCVAEIKQMEASSPEKGQFTIIILGGLSGRLDQTVHTLSYLHKLRKERKQTFAVTDENVGWVLNEGEHIIEVDRTSVGPTCGILPVGIDSTMLTTRGLEWDLTNTESSFDGMVSTSNHLASDEIYISITKPVWWCMELSRI